MFLVTLIEEVKWLIINKKVSNIKLVILDVDGVMTDGYLFYDYKGNQLKRFSVKDGLGIRYLQKAGIEIAIVSGGKEDVISNRAKDLDLKYVYCGIKNKNEIVKNIQKNLNFSKEETLFLGDDLNDLTVRNLVSLLIAPKDASRGLKKKCNAILKSNGGENAIRELAERLLKNTCFIRDISKDGFSEISN